MRHPVCTHMAALQSVLDALGFDANREIDSVRRTQLCRRTDDLSRVLQFYRNGLDLEEKVMAEQRTSDRQKRAEELRRLRDELKQRLLAGEGDELELRKKIIALAEEISNLES